MEIVTYVLRMPTVKDGPNGPIIVSRRRGAYITFQLSREGAEFLRRKFGTGIGSEIDVRTLLELKRLDYVYTHRQRRRRERHNPGLFDDPPRGPRPEPPPPNPRQTIACRECSAQVPGSAHYCPRCGGPLRGGTALYPTAMRSPAAQSTDRGAAWWVVGILAMIFGIYLLSKAH